MARIERLHAGSGSSSPRGQRSAAHVWTRLEAPRIDLEQLVHRRRVVVSELGVAVVAPAPGLRRRGVDRAVVGDVARRLLEVGGEAPALQRLREDVRDPLAGDVRAAELGDRVVAEAAEDALVEARGALALSALEGPAAVRHVGGELVEIEPAKRPRVARVAREQRPLDGLRQVDEAEDGPVEVREMGREQLCSCIAEGLDRIAHRAILAGARRGLRCRRRRRRGGHQLDALTAGHERERPRLAPQLVGLLDLEAAVAQPRRTVVSKSAATKAGWPSGGTVASGVWMR